MNKDYELSLFEPETAIVLAFGKASHAADELAKRLSEVKAGELPDALASRLDEIGADAANANRILREFEEAAKAREGEPELYDIKKHGERRQKLLKAGIRQEGIRDWVIANTRTFIISVSTLGAFLFSVGVWLGHSLSAPDRAEVKKLCSVAGNKASDLDLCKK